MKPIRWRRERGTIFSVANVDGVKLRSCDRDGYYDLRTVDFHDGDPVYLNLPNALHDRRHIDAAAYALADLVATLKGME